jgi:hypothetical protein
LSANNPAAMNTVSARDRMCGAGFNHNKNNE